MNVVLTFKSDDKRVQFLASTDAKLARLIKYIGSVDLVTEKDAFKCIVKYIVGQQISDRARDTIWMRLCNTQKKLTPIKMYNMPDAALRDIGISGRKVEYIKNLSRCIIAKEIDLRKLQYLSNEEIIDKLTSVKGIGRWTAEMYIIFSLGRVNVLSKGDGTIQRSIQWMYNLESLPTSSELTCYFNRWAGYETIVSAYFWESSALKLQQNSFDSIFS